MRKLKISNRQLSHQTKKLLSEAELKRIPPERQDKLLNEVRGGSVRAIAPLIDSCEPMIIMLAVQIQLRYGTAPEILLQLLDIGRQSLTKLANQELNSTHRERFLRFGAWVVKQRMLKEFSTKLSNK